MALVRAVVGSCLFRLDGAGGVQPLVEGLGIEGVVDSSAIGRKAGDVSGGGSEDGRAIEVAESGCGAQAEDVSGDSRSGCPGEGGRGA